jgi:putative pyruvate formate lyase activating enzyme
MPLLTSSEIFERAREAAKLSSHCRLCPRSCGVNRISGETGFCSAGPQPVLASILPHFGEEPPLTGPGGAGTIFFSGCNMQCVYCQNHQISQGGTGHPISPERLSQKILDLQRLGCCSLEPVSPSHHLPGFLVALAEAVAKGMTLPIVYNTNGYESSETLELLDGIVDVYLPDLKYASAAQAARYSATADYVEIARAAILMMHSQVGNLMVDVEGRAMRGVIIRHLVLPDDLAGSYETLIWLRDNLPRDITLSIMAQYTPLHKSSDFPLLNRAVTIQESEEVIDYAWSQGFENVFIQQTDSQEIGVPDFNLDRPFDWS